MANRTANTDDTNRDDANRAEGQRSIEQEKMTYDPYRETPPAPVAGSKDDLQKRKSRPEELEGPLHDEGERTGTDTAQ
jgi:hypothetical protein